MNYVEKKDKGIVTQALGFVSSLLVASLKYEKNESRSEYGWVKCRYNHKEVAGK